MALGIKCPVCGKTAIQADIGGASCEHCGWYSGMTGTADAEPQDAIETDYTDGRWIATTMGQFLQILIDSGSDPCVIFCVDEDIDAGDDKSFIRKMTVYSVPNGSVVRMCQELGIIDSDTHGIYKVLAEMIEGGLVS